MVLQQLQGHRALSGDHRWVVEGMDEHPALVGDDALGLSGGAGEIVARQHDVGAQRPGSLDLHEGAVGRHHDDRIDAYARRVAGDRLGVVAGRHGHHAAGALVCVERQQLVERATLLEGGGELQVLELDDDVGAEDLRQNLRV